MPAQYVDAWKISRNQYYANSGVSPFPQKASTVDIYAYLSNRRLYNGYTTYIRSDVVDWLEKNTDGWILDLCGKTAILQPDDAWNFIEWLLENRRLI